MGLAGPAVAQSVPFPTYQVGPQDNGSIVASTGQILTPAGKQVLLGSPVRAKAVAVNPTSSTHTAAVLTMGANAPVQVFDTLSGTVLQTYLPFQDSSGSYGGLVYSADGKWLFASQDSSNLAIAKVGTDGLLTDYAHVALPPNTSFIKCFPNSPIGDYGRPCGMLYTTNTSYPGGVAVSADGRSAYVLLNQNNTLGFIDLTQTNPVLGNQIRVGNAPHSVVLVGNYAYISNEGGRPAGANDFTVLSSGTPIVAQGGPNGNGSAVTGTVSVVDTTTQQVVANIAVGLHPTGMALSGKMLYVANTYSDSLSVIDTTTNKVVNTISLAVPVLTKPYGAAPTGMTIVGTTAYVTLYDANAIAVVDLKKHGESDRDDDSRSAVKGMIPTAYAPSSVAYDAANNQLIVSNDKGIGARGSFETDYGVTDYNTHRDTATVSIVPLAHLPSKLREWTDQVFVNNHWDLKVNVMSSLPTERTAHAVPLPAHIGDPSLIKHVFLIVRENRTYDQVLGDVAAGNGDPTLAVFGGNATPNAHALVGRFPLLDNFYDPSRQSADGHQWIIEAMAPYQDDVQAPDWVRSYPGGNAGDALAYTRKGFLFQSAVQAGLPVKLYGEYAENETWPTSLGHPSWAQLYADSQQFEAAYATNPATAQLQYENAALVESSVPSVQNNLIKNFPMFDLNVPDQFRVDMWLQDFNKDLANGTVPALSILWVIDDHTGGPPTPLAEQADNDLAVGRIIDYISHSDIWSSSAIFMEEDDAQNGVDHIDGHRSPGYVISPYAKQHQGVDHTFYTQMNMTRTIEQILGLKPLNQFDLLASPMATTISNEPKQWDFTPYTHLANLIPLNMGVVASAEPRSTLEKQWATAKEDMFRGKMTKPDSVDPYTLNHFDWYSATNFTRPYPGEKSVRAPSEFAARLALPIFDLDE